MDGVRAWWVLGLALDWCLVMCTVSWRMQTIIYRVWNYMYAWCFIFAEYAKTLSLALCSHDHLSTWSNTWKLPNCPLNNSLAHVHYLLTSRSMYSGYPSSSQSVHSCHSGVKDLFIFVARRSCAASVIPGEIHTMRFALPMERGTKWRWIFFCLSDR